MADRYCFLITIDDTDSRNNVVGTIRGAGSVFSLIVGRNQEPGSNPPIYNKYILDPTLLPVGTPELEVQGGVMINSDVPAVVRNEYSQDTVLWWTIELGVGINPTRAEMQARLRDEARRNRLCTHYWEIIPGASLTVPDDPTAPGNLLSKFTAF